MDSTVSKPQPSATFKGHLTIGNHLEAAGIAPSQVTLLRHTYTETRLTGPEDLASAKIMANVRE